MRHTSVDAHARTHTRTRSHIPPPTHTLLSVSSLGCRSLLSPCFLPHYVSLLLPSLFSIFFFSPSLIRSQSSSPFSPHRSLPLPSLSLPGSFVLPPPSPSLSFPLLLPPLLCVQSERGHYVRHSGHVQRNGGVCSESTRELGELGDGRKLQPRRRSFRCSTGSCCFSLSFSLLLLSRSFS